MTKKLLPFALLLLTGCVATHERPMNEVEDTIVSNQVLAMVDEAGGELDIREEPKVRCERIRLTGTHMVTRHCYTLAESARSSEQTQNAYYRRYGQHNRSLSGN